MLMNANRSIFQNLKSIWSLPRLKPLGLDYYEPPFPYPTPYPSKYRRFEGRKRKNRQKTLPFLGMNHKKFFVYQLIKYFDYRLYLYS